MIYLCLFGFIRKNEDITYNIPTDDYELFICAPKQQFEPRESKL